MRILGIDPGLNHTGFGVIDVKGDQMTLVTAGCIHIEKDILSNRLGIIHRELARIIEVIARHHINMESIQSRPIKGRPFEYFFFVEMDGDAAQVQACIEDMKENCESIKSLGTYSLGGQ